MARYQEKDISEAFHVLPSVPVKISNIFKEPVAKKTAFLSIVVTEDFEG